MNRKTNSIVFVDRKPLKNEIERLRLILSTYQDGTGMLAADNNLTLPGWRDYERAVALALNGTASENKDVFDVVLSCNTNKNYGISCKMRRELGRIERDGRVTIEVSNSAGKFWEHLSKYGLNQVNYKSDATKVGTAIIDLVNSWHIEEGKRRQIDIRKSFYLILSWDKSGLYQLHQFPLNLINANKLTWCFPNNTGNKKTARRLCGYDETGTLVEWYGESGGQLKFYPHATDAYWESEKFKLENLPLKDHGILEKAASYFPNLWIKANS